MRSYLFGITIFSLVIRRQGGMTVKRTLSLLGVILILGLTSCSNNTKEATNPSGKMGKLGKLKLSLDVKKFTLNNGLRVLIVENHRLPIFSYYTFFDVGGRFEGPGTTGATHFLEHMMFKGAKKYGPGKFDSIIESNGGSTNAYTTFDSTVYYQNMPSHTIDTIIDLEADRMENLLLEKVAFDKERDVVLEERKYRYENSSRGKLYLNMMQRMFEGTPYGLSVIGSVEDLLTLNRDQMFDFFKKFYTPDNAIIVVVGNVKASDVMSQIKKKFGDLKPSSDEIKAYKKEKDNDSLYVAKPKWGKHFKYHGNSKNAIFMMAYRGEPLGTRKAYVMDILSNILGSGSSSYFYQKYVKSKSPLLNKISVSNYNLQKNGVFFIGGELRSRTNLDKFRRTLQRETKSVCSKGIDDRGVQKTKNQFLVSYYGSVQDNAGVASFIGSTEKYYGDYKYYEKELEIYDSITTEEVIKVCNEVFSGNQQVFVSVWDRHKKVKGN